jgi:muramoyltetrapeptide carboxypeptidase
MRHYITFTLVLFLVSLPAIFSSCSSDDSSDINDGVVVSDNNTYYNSTIRPPFLSEGDSVGVVDVSSTITISVDSAQSILNRIRRWGLKIKVGAHTFTKTGNWFPASDVERASDVQAMIDDPNIRAIIFFRGGYGAIRTIEYLNLLNLRNNPKWIVGFSDVTVFHYALRTVGLESIHGEMPAKFNSDSVSYDASAESMRSALFGKVTGYTTSPSEYNQYGTAKGRLVGGNMTIIANLSETDIDNNFTAPSILLIEDVGEQIYAIDRRFQMLKRSGKLSRIKGLIIGHFLDTEQEPRWGSSVYELIHSYASQLNIPVIYSFPAGHTDPNFSLYMNRDITMTVDANGGKIVFE